MGLERDVRLRWSETLGGATEVVLPSGGRVDILTATHAYEVKPVREWRRAVGQAVSYAAESGVAPGLVLYGPHPGAAALEAIEATVRVVGADLHMELVREPRPTIDLRDLAAAGAKVADLRDALAAATMARDALIAAASDAGLRDGAIAEAAGVDRSRVTRIIQGRVGWRGQGRRPHPH